jgi:glycosyltransferase involved in cell wall biosynthesis
VLVVSRLLPYKRVDLAIGACRQLGLRLVIVGEGPCYPALRAISDSTVEFRGRVSEPDLNGLLHGCIAVVQAGTEDFGLASLEANAAGRPTVAFAAGGALETVIDDTTGVLVAEQTVDGFVAGVDRVRRLDWNVEKLRRYADSFSDARFHREMLQLLAADERDLVEVPSDSQLLADETESAGTMALTA